MRWGGAGGEQREAAGCEGKARSIPGGGGRGWAARALLLEADT